MGKKMMVSGRPKISKPTVSTAVSATEVDKVIRKRKRLKRIRATCGECNWVGETPLRVELANPQIKYWLCPGCSVKHVILPAENELPVVVDADGVVLDESEQ